MNTASQFRQNKTFRVNPHPIGKREVGGHSSRSIKGHTFAFLRVLKKLNCPGIFFTA
jgi:hypothetical protein